MSIATQIYALYDYHAVLNACISAYANYNINHDTATTVFTFNNDSQLLLDDFTGEVTVIPTH